MPPPFRSSSSVRCRPQMLALFTTAVCLPLAGQSPVEVTNFPEVQAVQGEVAIPLPVPHAAFQTVGAVLVSPTARGELGNVEPIAVVATAGFTEMMLSLHGEMRANEFREGRVGVVLVPDDSSVLESFREQGASLLALETTATTDNSKSSWLASTPTRVPIAFPRYRVFLYNTSDKTAEVSVHLYLTQ